MMLGIRESARIRDLVYRTSGIRLAENRTEYLSRRVGTRMEILDITRPEDYLRYLMFDPTGREMEALIDLIVVSETYFFRMYEQLALMAERIIPAIAEDKKEDKRLKILCAGCSTGEEPYTMAIILQEILDGPEDWHLRIDGLDISTRNLDTARRAIYSAHSLRETPHLYKGRYFSRKDDGFHLAPEIRNMVGFSRVNLFDPSWVSLFGTYDIVLCRNVLIYFDHDSAGKVMEHLFRAMVPGGYIFLGAAESVGKVSDLFTMNRLETSFVYTK